VVPSHATLRFSVGLPTTNVVSVFPSYEGSIASIIQSITLTTAAGVEISRITNAGEYITKSLKQYAPQEYIDSIGGLMGYCLGRPAIPTAAGLPQAAQSGINVRVAVGERDNGLRVVIPLHLLMPFFGSASGSLIPASLISGARIDITWKPATTAFMYSGDPGAVFNTYYINNLCLDLDTVTLSDGVMRALYKKAATEGLDYTYIDVENTVTTETSTRLDMTFSKAVSRALNCFVFSRLTENQNNPYGDSMASEENKVISTQVSVGALYYPQQALTCTLPAQGTRELMYLAEHAFNMVDSVSKMPAVTVALFQGNTPVTNVAPTNGAYRINVGEGMIAAATLQSSPLLATSGIPITNARTLKVQVQFSDASARLITFFTTYLKIAKVFLSKQIVRE
jgi:hypothetical protein